MSDKIQLINDLFSKIDYYEAASPHFHTHEFIENFNGVMSLFPAVQDKMNRIREIDQILSRRTQDINRSDLRQICVHLLTMFFKFSADVPSPYDTCYLISREKRLPHRDAGFVIKVLTPLLFSLGSLKKYFGLKYYFIKRRNEFLRKFAGWTPIPDNISVEEALRLPRHILFSDLVERHEQDSSRIRKEGMIENRLFQSSKYKLLAKENPFFKYLLKEKLGYPFPSIFEEIWDAIKRGIGRILGVFHLRFIWYVVTKRRVAYLFYTFLMLLILAAGVAVPFLWKSISQKKLDYLKRNTVQTRERSSVSFLEKEE